MNTRQKRVKGAKKAAAYGSAATAGTTSAFEFLSIFMAIPGWIKWVVAAAVGLVAACIGCCRGMQNDPEPGVEPPDEQYKALAKHLAEIEKDIKYYHHPHAAEKAAVKWVELTKELKKQQELKPHMNAISSRGLFATREQNSSEEKKSSNVVVLHIDTPRVSSWR